jgi:hypothetical protein
MLFVGSPRFLATQAPSFQGPARLRYFVLILHFVQFRVNPGCVLIVSRDQPAIT